LGAEVPIFPNKEVPVEGVPPKEGIVKEGVEPPNILLVGAVVLGPNKEVPVLLGVFPNIDVPVLGCVPNPKLLGAVVVEVPVPPNAKEGAVVVDPVVVLGCVPKLPPNPKEGVVVVVVLPNGAVVVEGAPKGEGFVLPKGVEVVVPKGEGLVPVVPNGEGVEVPKGEGLVEVPPNTEVEGCPNPNPGLVELG